MDICFLLLIRKGILAMKKLLTLLLTVVLSFSLAACGGKMSKDDMLDKATEITPQFLQDIVDGAEANEAKLIDDYEGMIVSDTGIIVSDIDSDGTVTLGISTVKVYCKLQKEDIVQFEKGDLISVVGVISNISVISKNSIKIELNPVYLVETLGASSLKGNI